MLNLIYQDRGKLVITGFKMVHDVKYLAVRNRSEMLLITFDSKKRKPDLYCYFDGLADPNFKRYMDEYLEQRGVIGLQFAEIGDTYFEMTIRDTPAIEDAIKENHELLLEDPDNFYIYVL